MQDHRSQCIVVYIGLICVSVTCAIQVQDLGGNMWSAAGSQPPSTVTSTVTNNIPWATVPGTVHTDWYNISQKMRENEPYYRFNDLNLRWIAEVNWKYERTFQTSPLLFQSKEQYLVCEGLDTIASVFLNEKHLGNTNNMFVKHVFNVTGILQKQFNRVTVSFTSAIQAANSTNRTLPYLIPPECPPDVQHGFCHVNLIRKEQCSFSWDWGPGFATQGIWRPIYLLGLDDIMMSNVAVTYNWDMQELLFDIHFRATSNSSTDHMGTLTVYIDELEIKKSFPISVKTGEGSPTSAVSLGILSSSVSLWWPNGQGEQKLYNVTVDFVSKTSLERTNRTIWFGFRKVELVQETIPGSDGLSFYFKINSRPIFAKGSNWIPPDAFRNRLSRSNYTNLLQSAKDANMNMLRVWGGGIYEHEDFYDIADRLGIMIWHDFMFACAMYPADNTFLSSVTKEVNETVLRLKSHPSIVIWAGNNENEAALGTDWYNVSSHFDRYHADYVSLYIDTIGQAVTVLDRSRPYLSSSPTNGVESKSEGWVSKNPYDTRYGDVHYYNYNDDCLDWTKYPKTRFASEYGFQSWPSLETLSPVTTEQDLSWDSEFAQNRQHHAQGNEQMLNQISMNFKLPESTVEEAEKFAKLVYLSQIMQGLCYKSETEFYRRSRGEIVKGEGHTMGALYWQLNDIWQAPTWSSIEYGGKWKAVHYFAKDFFSKVALVAFNDDSTMTIYSVSDENAPIEPVTLVIEMRQWKSFDVLSTWTQPLYVQPQSSQNQYQNSTGLMLHYGGCDYKELCYFTIRLEELEDVPPTYFYPVEFKNIDGLQASKITVVDMKYAGMRPLGPSVLEESYMFDISLSTTAPAAFVWLEAGGIQGHFSENAFHFYQRSKTVVFYAQANVSVVSLKNSLKVKSLSDIYNVNRNHAKKHPRSSIIAENVQVAPKDNLKLVELPTMQDTFWLDEIGPQLTFAICGILFILFCSILLVCVVIRFNAPNLDKRPSIKIVSNQGSRKCSRTSPLLEENEFFPPIEDISEDDTGAFMIKMKHGYGHKAKNVEIHFYIT